MKQIRVGKWRGNDAYSWAVFVNGRAVMTGLSRIEAAYQKNVITGMYAENEKGKR